MPSITYCVVQPFERTEKGGYRVKEAIQAQNRDHAVRTARKLAEKGGAIAFSRTGDPNIGDYSAPEILGVFGEVPDDFTAEAA